VSGDGAEFLRALKELREEKYVPRKKPPDVCEVQPPLTDNELFDVREMLKERDRRNWIWRAVKTWALWISAVVAGVNYGWEALGRVVQALSGGGSH
jgi:hypothetical protein